jgi:hypothetical protein
MVRIHARQVPVYEELTRFRRNQDFADLDTSWTLSKTLGFRDMGDAVPERVIARTESA